MSRPRDGELHLNDPEGPKVERDVNGKKLRMDVLGKVLAAVLLGAIIALYSKAIEAGRAVYVTVPAHEDLFRGPVDSDTGHRDPRKGVLGRLRAVEERPSQPALTHEDVEDLRAFLAEQKPKAKAGGS